MSAVMMADHNAHNKAPWLEKMVWYDEGLPWKPLKTVDEMLDTQ